MTVLNAGAATFTPRNVSTVAGANAPALTIVEPLLPLTDVPSACPDDSVRIGARIDPFWSDLWPVGSKATWVDAVAARAQVAAGIARLPKYLEADEAKSAERVTDLSRLDGHLDILSVLDSWRSATGEQLAAFTGQSVLASGKSKTMTDLFTAGLADVGIFSSVLFSTRNTARGALYRPAATTVFEKKVAPLLTYTEWLSTTGGMKNTVGGGGHDRHNTLTTELALRVAELCDVGTVVGEKLSTADLLAYTSIGRPSRGPNYNRAADMTIVRQDGARIAVEMTARVGKSFELKVAHWAELLATNRMEDTGLAVLFVIIGNQAGGKGGRPRGSRVRNDVYKIVRDAVKLHPGVSFDRVASRIGIADWQEWFPEPGVVSPSFFELDCDRPTGDGDTLWERASFLDESSLTFAARTPWAVDSLETMSMLRSVPHWLREERTPPELTRALLAAAGMTAIPVPVHARPDLATGGRKFGAAHGFVGATKPPLRMRPVR